MPVKDTETNEVNVDLEERVKALQEENESLKKSMAQLQHDLNEQVARYGKLFGLFANNIDYYLGNK